jgi:putative copper export protein
MSLSAVLTLCRLLHFAVRDWSRLLGSAYGEVLTVKVALVVALIGFACFNCFYLMPRLESQPRYSRWLMRSVWSELAFGGLILLAATVLGTLAPPVSMPAPHAM